MDGYIYVTMKVVLDTSVLVAAARSRQGASFAIVSFIPNPTFQPCLSVALYLEWQAVLSRAEHLPPRMTAEGALGFLRYLAAQAHLQDIHYLWRPFLSDPDDDMVLELAVAAGCPYIVTHNVADFRRASELGVTAISPWDFLALIRSAT
jgi:putative PIN family toxin of toxin-antitoxin system